MKTSNVVLYAVNDGKARPLISADANDSAAPAKVQHAASAEYSRNEKSGVPLSRLVAVLEVRESNEAGQQIGATFTPLAVPSLDKNGETVRDLGALFADKE